MSVTRPLGFRAAGLCAGLKPSGKPDLALIVCDPPDGAATAPGKPGAISSAAVFTSNVVVGAPIEIGRRWRSALAHGGPALRGVLINAGNANAATGKPGVTDAMACAQEAAARLGCDPEEILPSSTGVVGRRLPVEKIRAAIPDLVGKLARGSEADDAVANAILTTDLVPKTAHREVEVHGHTMHIGAVTKGSGMIMPVLDAAGRPVPHATMLAFITLDASVDPATLQSALEDACAESFNRISVDAHPSCSDTVVAMASGHAPIPAITRESPSYHVLRSTLAAICTDLAEQIVRDGEGASRTFRIEVRGAATQDDALHIAREVVNSPLVKCAIHGKDPNWGRIVTAAGNAGVPFDPGLSSLRIGGVEVYRAGVPTEVPEDDPALVAAMNEDPVQLELSVGPGEGNAWFLGCDLTAGYVTINADYTT